MYADDKNKKAHKCVCKLKWFNESKGFGFLVPEEVAAEELIGRDAFVHVSLLQDKGITSMGQDAKFSCIVSDCEKGLFVDEVLELTHQGDMDAQKIKVPLPPEAGTSYSLKGIVKWYRMDKEYGFVAGDDGKKDIFIHQTCLRRNNIEEKDFQKGVCVLMKIRDVDQGREVVDISITPCEDLDQDEE